MPAYAAKRYEEFLQQAIGSFVVRAGLTDVADSSVVKGLFAGVCELLDGLSYQTTNQRRSWDLSQASGADLDSRAYEQTAGKIVRSSATVAQGTVVFSARTPGGTITIPAGTQVQNAANLSFVTTADVTIAPDSPVRISGHVIGQDSPPAPIVAQTAGTVGNVPALTLTRFGQRPTGIDTVVNLVPTNFGQDQETDDALRARVRTYAATLSGSTNTALEGAVLGAVNPDTGTTIQHARVVESEKERGLSTLYIDDGSGQALSTQTYAAENLTAALLGPGGNTAVGGEVTLPFVHKPIAMQSPPVLTSSSRGPLVIGQDFVVQPLSGIATFTPALTAGETILADYTAYTGLIALAQKIVDGDRNDPLAFPQYRAAGTRVIVTTPQVIFQTVTGALSTDLAYSVEAVQQAAAAAIAGYINSLSIGESVLVSKIIAAVMSTSGVLNITLAAPTRDQLILPTQLARIDPSPSAPGSSGGGINLS